VDEERIDRPHPLPDEERNRLVADVGDEQRQQEPAHGLGDECIEQASRNPLRNDAERENPVDLTKIERRGLASARQAGNDVGDDVIAERPIEAVAVVADRVLGVELVAVLAVDEAGRIAAKGRDVGEREVVHQPLPPKFGAQVRVPPHFGVVIARQVGDAPPLGRREASEGGEKAGILGLAHGQGRAVFAGRNVGDAQEIEEVAGEHQFHRAGLAIKIVEQRGQIVLRFEDVAPVVAADVAIREEDDEGVVIENARRIRLAGSRSVHHAAVSLAMTASGISKLA
jgi:hypothetical protein